MSVREERFAEIYDQFYDDVYFYCLRRTDRQQLEDAVANVFLIAWRKIDDVPPGREALYWLYRVAYRSIGKQWRTDSRRRRLENKLQGLGRDLPPPPDDYLVQDEEARLAIEAASRLKPTDREVLLLAIWEQLPQPEIAETLQISTDAVKQRLHRARKKLTQEFLRLSSNESVVPTAQEGGAW